MTAPPNLENLILLTLTLTVPDYRRRLVGRLRTAVTGWHYPRFRMARRALKLVRPRAITTTAKP
jgi:hypothetical protein